MTLPHIPDPTLGDAASVNALPTVIIPRVRDIGDFEVRRALPSIERQMIGPFIFFDQFGPIIMKAGEGQDVRPHPHIGLSTVTWLMNGSMYHRDSLGSQQAITPGELNWMTAGKGIVHSERTPELDRATDRTVYGIQSWVALPKKHEETRPGFEHVDSASLPLLIDHGREVRVIAGSIYGAASPVKTHSELFYAEVKLAQGAKLPLPMNHEERAIYVLEGTIDIAGQTHTANQLLVFRAGDAITISALSNARFMRWGGVPMDGPRHSWWLCVSSWGERIEVAKEEWRRGRFDIVPGDEKEFIPLPS